MANADTERPSLSDRKPFSEWTDNELWELSEAIGRMPPDDWKIVMEFTRSIREHIQRLEETVGRMVKDD